MARVSVKMYATVREASGMDEVQVDASNLAELLDALVSLADPGLRRLLSTGAPRSDVLVVLLNGRNITPVDPSSVELSEGDEVAIFPPVSGG
ncbi:MAG: MoaD family protein [Candidatus Thermoplasmatota archaeon]|nr:MoaD family protein [Candidatus Thermoplasmatota archaeon]